MIKKQKEPSVKQLGVQLGGLLLDKGWYVSTAESCTGGWISKIITDVPGSSQWFNCSFVTYSNEAKRSILNVSSVILKKFGAVSEEVALEMANGLLELGHSNVALSVTGVAGPDGGTNEKPVGMVCFGLCVKGLSCVTKTFYFSGTRKEIRKKAVKQGLTDLVAMIIDSY